MLLSADKTSSPIPTLAERQFIVSRSTASKSEEVLSRTLFWYREELLNLIKASWKEPGTARRGYLSLRSQRLTEPMLDVLRADEVVISLRVRDAASSHDGGARPVVEENKFFDVVVKVRNRLGMSISSRRLCLSSPPWLTVP
jgi:hypothetical protein